MVMAQQALTTSLATGGRFTLGIGLSHKFIVEDWQGLHWARPARHLRDYLSVLMPLLRGEKVDYAGEEYRSRLNNAPFTRLDVPGAPVPQVLVAALGPAMLKVTGELADGTSLFWCGPNYIERTVVPAITQAASAAGRPAPRILSGLPIAVTSKEQSARDSCAKVWQVYGQIYSYKQVIAAEGTGSTVADLATYGFYQRIKYAIGTVPSGYTSGCYEGTHVHLSCCSANGYATPSCGDDIYRGQSWVYNFAT